MKSNFGILQMSHLSNLKLEFAFWTQKVSQWWTMKEQVMFFTKGHSIKKTFNKQTLTTETKMANQISNIDWFTESRFQAQKKKKISSLISNAMIETSWRKMTLLVKQPLNWRKLSMIAN